MRIWLLLSLCACVPTRVYRLPLAPEQAHLTFAPIATRAGELGLRATEELNGVVVQADDRTSIRFVLSEGRYDMIVRVDAPAMTAMDGERRLSVAVRLGRQIWRSALAAMAGALGDTRAAETATDPPS